LTVVADRSTTVAATGDADLGQSGGPSFVSMGMIIGLSLTSLQLLEDIAGGRPRETRRRSDDNSRRKMQNVRGDWSAGCGWDG
jgi:hypothetical protein